MRSGHIAARPAMKMASIAMLFGAALSAAACQKAAAPAPESAAAPTAATPAATSSLPEYHPSMADLMNLAVQPRHIKLALAGKAKNWDYAAYETDELRNAFDRIARTIPDYRGNNLAKMFDANIKPAIAEMKTAAQAKDAKAFEAAYAKVTMQCTACHEALDHPMIRIRAPGDATLFPDQDFAPTPADK
jgi:hypothetical protein